MRAPTNPVSINHVGTGVLDRPLTKRNLRTVREAVPYAHRDKLCEIIDPDKPEFARYIEVKSTTRVTEPSFDDNWTDSLNLTSKEWVAAEQYKEYYNIYRVYFTKQRTFVVRIKNPYELATQDLIEVYPTTYQMNFNEKVIEHRYAGE